MNRIKGPIELILKVAEKLVRANIPFDMAHQDGQGILTCKFEETLQAALRQARTDLINNR